MSKIVCPYCFEQFNSSDVRFRCSNEGCTKSDDPELHKFWGRAQMELPAVKPSFSFSGLLGNMPEKAVCPECNHTTYLVICPHCHNRLPKEMVRNRGYIISIIGARSSGKTNYITTLINELQQKGWTLGNISMMASAVSTRPEYATALRYERDFYDVMYKRSKLPAATRVGDESSRIPLIYELAQKGKRPIHLVLYDTAGENFDNPGNIAANVKFLRESDGIIFLLDTFSIPEVHRRLENPLKLPKIELKYDHILNNVCGFFSEGDPAVAKAHFKKPLALVFSKIDSIISPENEQYFSDISLSGMSLDRNSSFLDGSGVSLADFEGVSENLKAALAAWGERNFLGNIDNHYTKNCYFGISALGGAPDIKTGTIHNLRPYRVLDPLVWILNELGYTLKKNK